MPAMATVIISSGCLINACGLIKFSQMHILINLGFVVKQECSKVQFIKNKKSLLLTKYVKKT